MTKGEVPAPKQGYPAVAERGGKSTAKHIHTFRFLEKGNFGYLYKCIYCTRERIYSVVKWRPKPK